MTTIRHVRAAYAETNAGREVPGPPAVGAGACGGVRFTVTARASSRVAVTMEKERPPLAHSIVFHSNGGGGFLPLNPPTSSDSQASYPESFWHFWVGHPVGA